MKSTKILFGAGLFITFIFLTALFVAFLLNLQSPPASPNSKNNINSSIADGNNFPKKVVLTTQEIAKHSNANDCWMIVDEKVYDLTTLVFSHSGGSQTILQDCGKDGSVEYNKKYGKDHSVKTDSILNSFYIGNLGQQIQSSVLQNKTSSITNTDIPKKREKEDD